MGMLGFSVGCGGFKIPSHPDDPRQPTHARIHIPSTPTTHLPLPPPAACASPGNLPLPPSAAPGADA